MCLDSNLIKFSRQFGIPKSLLYSLRLPILRLNIHNHQHKHISRRSLKRVRQETSARLVGVPEEAARINAAPSVGNVSAEVLAVCGRRCGGE